MNVASVVDTLIEAPVVTSFTRIGYHVRSRLDHWTPLDQYDLRGRTIVVTGATSGLGRRAAEQFASLGAHVVISGRNRAKVDHVRDQIRSKTTSTEISVAYADMAEPVQVKELAEFVMSRHHRIDVLIHNAGALANQRTVNSIGIETTVASQVLGPFLLTTLLLPALRSAPAGRVLTMSSGGMYTTGLTVRQLQMDEPIYRGSEQYARAKRAQVTLNEMWAKRVEASEVVFHSLHPGWADTPGVETSLPTFHRVMRPLLRSTAEGADTLIWLAADDGEPLSSSGGFWLDRRGRPIHKLASTRRSDTPQRRLELWAWCTVQSAKYLT